MDMGIPPLRMKILRESNPPKSRILERRLTVLCAGPPLVGGRDVDHSQGEVPDVAPPRHAKNTAFEVAQTDQRSGESQHVLLCLAWYMPRRAAPPPHANLAGIFTVTAFGKAVS